MKPKMKLSCCTFSAILDEWAESEGFLVYWFMVSYANTLEEMDQYVI